MTKVLTQHDTEALLQASRRVDWRFLLPDPELGRVGYAGPARGALVDALRKFSASLTVYLEDRGPSQRSPQLRMRPGQFGSIRTTGETRPGSPLEGEAAGSGQFDVVVAIEPAITTLEQAVQGLRPDGWLYVEAHGPALRGPLRIARDYAAALRRLGMADVEAHWHWPNFESCAEIVPLDEKAALLSVFERHRSEPSARLKSTFGRWLLRSGLLARVVPHFSIVARRTGAPAVVLGGVSM